MINAIDVHTMQLYCICMYRHLSTGICFLTIDSRTKEKSNPYLEESERGRERERVKFHRIFIAIAFSLPLAVY